MRLLTLSFFLLLIGPAAGHEAARRQIDAISRDLRVAPSAELHLQRGELYRLLHEWERALGDYEAALQREPAMTAPVLARAQLYLDLQRGDLALEHLAPLLQSHPELGPAWLLLARSLHLAGRDREAAGAARRAWSLLARPQPDHFLEAADWLAGATPPAPREAIACLEEGLVRLGACVPLELRALALERDLCERDAALARVDRLMKTAARRESWWLLRGEVLEEAGRVPAAAAAYREGVRCILSLPPHQQQRPATRSLLQALTHHLSQVRPAAAARPPADHGAP